MATGSLPGDNVTTPKDEYEIAPVVAEARAEIGRAAAAGERLPQFDADGFEIGGGDG